MRIEIDSLAYRYEQKVVLEDLTCCLNAGQIHIILGVNGAGKSTLVKLLNRLLKPRSGKILIAGKDLADLTLNQIARRIGYVAQQQQTCELTLTDYILLGRKPHLKWNFGIEDEKIVFAVMKKFNLGHLALRPLTHLSGGELQKTIIARALVQKPEILLLDEPTSNLDLKNQIEVMEILQQETAEYALTTVIAMHDINLALRYASSFTLLKGNRVMVSGGMEVITQDNLSTLFGIRVKLYNLDGYVTVIPE